MGLILVVVVVVVISLSKICQKVGESLKSPKSLKGLKKLQKPSIWKNVYQSTDLPSITYEELSFSSSFCWAQEFSRYHVWNNYRHGKANGAVDTLSRFSPEEPERSLSQKHPSLLPAVTNGPSAPSFCLQDARFSPVTSILEIRSERRRSSPISGWKRLMAEKMSRKSARPVLHS